MILLCRWIVIGANRPRIGVSIQIPGLKWVEDEEETTIYIYWKKIK
jgi:hypothetical protein